LYEGFGLPVLEAMASGVPVVTTRRGALEEIAGPALFCNPLDPRDIAEAIRVAREPQRRARLVAAGQEHARRFTWHRTANETLAVLLEAVGTP
jgi:glycosyltransferase involved in cell wall biosynthesis